MKEYCFLKYVLISGLALLMSSCKHKALDPDLPIISYSKHVQPIILSNCTAPECHASNSIEFSLVGYFDIINSGKIIKGDARGSTLIKVLKENNSSKVMPPPPNNKLDNAQIQIIELWIEQGAVNN